MHKSVAAVGRVLIRKMGGGGEHLQYTMHNTQQLMLKEEGGRWADLLAYQSHILKGFLNW